MKILSYMIIVSVIAVLGLNTKHSLERIANRNESFMIQLPTRKGTQKILYDTFEKAIVMALEAE